MALDAWPHRPAGTADQQQAPFVMRFTCQPAPYIHTHSRHNPILLPVVGGILVHNNNVPDPCTKGRGICTHTQRGTTNNVDTFWLDGGLKGLPRLTHTHRARHTFIHRYISTTRFNQPCTACRALGARLDKLAAPEEHLLTVHQNHMMPIHTGLCPQRGCPVTTINFPCPYAGREGEEEAE